MMLLITCLKHTSADYFFDSVTCNIDKLLLLHDQESNLEKEEQEKHKTDSDDKMIFDLIANLISNGLITGQKISSQPHTYFAFISNSNTPPPELS